ncbi:hypothetical protein GUJ93_ZPchr0008g12339 [Zizania palustris]|uniref:Uncharacterized protein n=1 Tax=Zizania palustris TaxID=103762 RepID=A0A8J5V0N7_ZIZPA|nr:hypothetical protein GUJ93_ZPchr0008g12339 [Zizania palustris]
MLFPGAIVGNLTKRMTFPRNTQIKNPGAATGQECFSSNRSLASRDTCWKLLLCCWSASVIILHSTFFLARVLSSQEIKTDPRPPFHQENTFSLW